MHTNTWHSTTTTSPWPNLLIIDGIRTATEHVDRLQIIVTDNDSPPIEGIHRALELSDTDRLVPMSHAEPGDEQPADPPAEEAGA
ncbi:hypothetical protein [Streptomyces sp. A1136]|uniref:hypothetical protein n=1 Tax=Streptomyces sp. A1136 TaxID=2563102 RepID=UPI00109EBEB9|nr:hypothetical protein [Streptomyces sp. A1136]THA47092.1 hypothetical protein E6R62_32025 [Streptomyces sp. A1136]